MTRWFLELWLYSLYPFRIFTIFLLFVFLANRFKSLLRTGILLGRPNVPIKNLVIANLLSCVYFIGITIGILLVGNLF